MRLCLAPYVLTQEDADRLCRILSRFGGSRTLRDLRDRHHFQLHQVEAAAVAGIVRIEKLQPHTGRPSWIALISPDSVNKSRAAKLPTRQERPLPLSVREESFLRHYGRKYGHAIFGPRGSGSVAGAYRKAYDPRNRLKPDSVRSAGARLARQPWIQAGRALAFSSAIDRLPSHYPYDLRSRGDDWCRLTQALNGCYGRGSWSADVRFLLRSANTYTEALQSLQGLKVSSA